MFRIIRDPSSAFIGETEVRLLYYSENLESRIEAPLSALRGVRVDQYPAMLDCTLILNDLHIQDDLEICYLYRSYPSEDIRLCFGFGSPQGIWKNDVAIGAAMRELLILPEISEIRKNFQVDHDNADIFFYSHSRQVLAFRSTRRTYRCAFRSSRHRSKNQCQTIRVPMASRI